MQHDITATIESVAKGPATGHILVVDDERVNRELLVRLLRRHGHHAVGVSGGREALEAISQQLFDVVLLDVVMPEMDGFECLKLIREIKPVSELPVIMVTAEAERDRIVSAFRAGANEYVTKPIDAEITLARIAPHLQLRQALGALRDSEERYALAARGANDGLWDWNVHQNEVFYSARWKNMLGYLESEIGTSPAEWLDRIHPEDRSPFAQVTASRSDSSLTHLETELRMLHKNGSYRWMLCRGVYVRDGEGEVYRMAGSLTDITEGKVGDPLTGLPNRLLFVDRLERAIERAKRLPDEHFAVIFLDLDNFKLVNDSMGHEAGDRLLITVAKRLEQSLRTSDCVIHGLGSTTVARHAGDEFTMLLEGLTNPSHAELVAERIRATLAEPIALEALEVFPTASMGIAIGNCQTQNAEMLLREADTAMYHAKAEGRNRHRLFDPGMQFRATERLELEKDLRRALQENEFFLHYQPVVTLKTGQTVGFETLVRWQHPRKGTLSPLAFVRAAEEMGLIVPLGWWIMQRACEQAALWQTQYGPPFKTVGINTTVKQLYQTDFLDRFRDIVVRTGVDATGISVEVTESTLMDKPDIVRPILSGLRDLGVRIAIDDFGTGYSSLAYLHRIPLDMLKIDRSFVSTMQESNESLEIVRTIIDLARSLKLTAVAEGVETESQRATLLELGVSYAQGYLWAPPVNDLRAGSFHYESDFSSTSIATGIALPATEHVSSSMNYVK